MANTNNPSGTSPASNPWPALGVGTVLILLALLIFVLSKPADATSVGAEAIGGFVLLMLSLTGLIIISQALGLTTPGAALGLPGGSVRALIAFSMVIAFVAIASWTLGDHGVSGSIVDSQMVNPDAPADVAAKMAAEQTIYPAPRFLTVLNRGAKAVQVVDSQGQQQLFDLQKQILTIIATALVTIIGFYFGSKSAADATAAATTTLASMGTAIANAQNQTPTSAASTPAPTIDSLSQVASQVRALATAAATKLESLGADPLADLKQAVAPTAAATLQATLAAAQAAFDKLTQSASATDSFADSAEAEIAKLDPASAAPALTAAQQRLQGLLANATSANSDIDAALAAFTAAETAIRSATADG